jgi:hypothetical protein
MAEIPKVRIRRDPSQSMNIWVHAYVESLAAPEKQDLGPQLNELGDSVLKALLRIDDSRVRLTNEAMIRNYRIVQSVVDELGVQLNKAEQLKVGDAEPLLKAVSALSELSTIVNGEIEYYAAQDLEASS